MWIDALEAAIDKDRIGTHWVDCYLEHKDCAILRLIDVAKAGRALAEATAEADMVLSEIVDSFPDGNPPHPSILDCINAGAPLVGALAAFREAEGG